MFVVCCGIRLRSRVTRTKLGRQANPFNWDQLLKRSDLGKIRHNDRVISETLAGHIDLWLRIMSSISTFRHGAGL
jgi:hypothetical protein